MSPRGARDLTCLRGSIANTPALKALVLQVLTLGTFVVSNITLLVVVVPRLVSNAIALDGPIVYLR